MDLFANIKRINKNVFLFSMDTNIDAVINIQPYGYLLDHEESCFGYAHLLEHMTIKASNEYLNLLEERGLIFNAETQENQTCYNFLDLNGSVVIQELEKNALERIYSSVFTDRQLDIERKTIMEEHLLLSNIHGQQTADFMIGTTAQIKDFNLRTLMDIRQKHYKEPICLVMGNPYHFVSELSTMEQHLAEVEIDWFCHLDVENIYYNNKFPILELDITPYSELLAYCLRVFFSPTADASIPLKVTRKAGKLKVLFLGNRECLKKTMVSQGKYKENAYFKYYINLSNSRFLQSELVYIVNYLYPLMDITLLDFMQLFFYSLWEEALYEKLFILQS